MAVLYHVFAETDNEIFSNFQATKKAILVDSLDFSM